MLSLSWNVRLLLPSDIDAPGSQAFSLGLELTPSALLDLRLAEGRLWDFSASITV